MWILGALSAVFILAPRSLLQREIAHESNVVLGPKEGLHGDSASDLSALMLVQEGLHSRRLAHGSIRGSPLENQPQLYGLPKIVVVIVADVLAMLCFLGCIPLMLVLSKRRQPMA